MLNTGSEMVPIGFPDAVCPAVPLSPIAISNLLDNRSPNFISNVPE